MPKRLLTGFLAVLSSWCSPAGAQIAPTLHVVVEELSEDARVCGIDEASIESAAVHALRDRGIRVAASLASPYSYLYVAARVKSFRRAGEPNPGCVVGTRVEVVGVSPTQVPVGGFKGPQSRRNTVETILCSSAGSSNGSPPEFGAQFARDLERSIKLCLGNVI